MQKNMKFFFVALTISSLGLVCTQASAAKPEVPKASKKAPAEAEPPPTQTSDRAAAPQEGMALFGDIIFIGSKLTGSHECIFKSWKGTAFVPEGNLEKASLSFEIETASIVADYKNPTQWSMKLQKHLKKDDFFGVTQFPKATFESISIVKAKGAPQDQFTIAGNLTIKGVTKHVAFPAQIKSVDGKFEATAEFTINRQDFGISYPGKPDNLISDYVVLKISIKS